MSLWDPGLIKCDEDIRHQLSSLPEGLDEIYTRCLHRIEHTYNKSSREISPKLFRWVACANEPLTQLQAREAVSMTPDNIPLRKSQILNTPAEDHCANLVVLDEISGRVVFPHPSVRDFLQDPLKVPENLHHYLLSAERDELWCGELCLAYAHYLHTRKQIVPYKTARMQENIPSLFVKDIPGVWLSSLFRKPRPNQAFHMPLPTSTQKTEAFQESCLHDYMRRNWLSHNSWINRDAQNYFMFTTLCLGQDPQIQPWATERATETEHYQKLFEFAVMTNHASLFSAVAEYLQQGKAGILTHVLTTSCPGTESTLLDVCAALGHKEVMQLVLRHCSEIKISHGKNAAILALEHENFELFEFLVPNPLPDPRWAPMTSTLYDGPFSFYPQNLLRACAIYGNGTITDMLLCRFEGRLSQKHLSDALLHAWEYNSLEVACKIISAGASLEYLDLIEQERKYYMSHFSLDMMVVPTLFIAWRLGNVQIWDTVWRAPVDALTWLDIIMQQARTAASRDRIHTWNEISRKLLTAVDTAVVVSHVLCDFQTVESLKTLGGISAPMLCWLGQVPDDILVRVLKNGLIRRSHMLQPEVIKSLASRWSSRGLEGWLKSLYIEQGLCRWQADEPSVRTRLSSALKRAADRYSPIDHRNLGPAYAALLSILSAQAIKEGRVQVADFFACYEFAGEDGMTFGREKQNMQAMLSAWDVAARLASVPLPPTLTWLRLHSMNADSIADRDIVREPRHKHKLKPIDGNFSLNYPAGYDLVGQKPGGSHLPDQAASTTIIGLPVKRCIVEAVYRWNHRLQSKHVRPGTMITECLSDAE